MTYARIVAGVVAEVVELAPGVAPSEVYAGADPDGFVACREGVGEGWTFDGEWWRGAGQAICALGLDDLKAALLLTIDAAAEAERLKYITAGAGQAMTYQQKASEAVMLEDDPDPQLAAYPLLSAEIGITAPTLAEVGVIVRQAHGQWILIGAGIEAVRLAAKRAVTEAATHEAAQAAADVTWPA